VGAHFTKVQMWVLYLSFYPDWIKRIFLWKLDKTFLLESFDSGKGFITYQDIVPNAEELCHEIEQTFINFNTDFSDTL
jgi:hypothetical protein